MIRIIAEVMAIATGGFVPRTPKRGEHALRR